MKNKILCAILAIMLISSAGCASGKKEEVKENEKATEVSETKGTEGDADETSDAAQTEDAPLANPEDVTEVVPTETVVTPHVEFKYFDEWNENVRFESVTADNGNYEVRCYGVGSIDGFHCFSMIFGDAEGLDDHYMVGKLTKDAQSVNVYTYVNQNFEGLNDEQISLINDTVLSYYMNELTYQLNDVEGYQTAH